MSMRPITEDDLQAFVDNALDAERRRDVSEYLLANPEAAARVSSYRTQAAALRLTMDAVAREPVPSRLNLKTIMAARPISRRPQWFRLAAAAVLMLTVGATGGWITRGYTIPSMEGVAALAQEASASYSVFAPDRLRPVEVRFDGSENLQQLAAATLGRSAAIPDLSKSGYRLMGGRVIPTAHGPGFMLMYDNDKGSRIVMLARHMTVDQDKPMVESGKDDIRGWSWAKNGMGYSLVGSLPSEELHPIADAVRSQV
ncbi:MULTISPECIES: anti-sigma factor family protein [Rhizobium]|uniref:Anti-sigma factor n=1 Tax=Rhizobium leguminosarum bv. viciae TaxID=387 RepID=A0A8G2MPZ6_RHILV|nr:anti-sigma factor [Rhizobium leguminosarum]MBY5325063.1 anti-sigma factor [Rhizobium leguminosarum]MBY5385843.1 anti-sigma factor [Rhizobium leguminosarum]MBY5424794.1 anti-sigma factor [Rhizobium leguminosarum]MCA2436157.1 anti-sigma factor [Rhizobium leguminosarum]NEH74668.1 anti-sigma factor [Rhizobium leguminosarum]